MGACSHLPRKTFRFLHFLWVGMEALLTYPFWRFRGESRIVSRCLWMQCYARKFSRVVHLRVRFCGTVPVSGLVVSNHLGYVDILALGSVIPGVFVAKKEVAAWPLLGPLARCAGTLFVHRGKGTGLCTEIAAMEEILQHRIPVILFPEGTSSGGDTVLPFRSSLFQAAAGVSSVVPVALEYHLAEGSVSEEVCYWKDMTLFPHLWNLFGKKEIAVIIRFGPEQKISPNRKELAASLHRAVLELYQQPPALSWHS